MIDLDDELTEYAREWRATQPALPLLVVEPARAHRRSRALLVAAVVVVVLALGAVVFAMTRSESTTPPTIDTPTTATPGSVPQLDVVPLYFPVDAADMAAAAGVFDQIGYRLTADHPSHRQVVYQNACNIGFFGVRNGRLNGFEDPASYVGPPVTPTFTAPPAPPAVRCTDEAARAAARIRNIVTSLNWLQLVEQTDGDDAVHAAKVQDVQCLAERGVAGVTFSFIADPSGMSQAHPEWNTQIQIFADCFAPVVAARAPVRHAFRDSFLADHAGEIRDLRGAFDDYLRAIYHPAPHSKTVTTEPDLARFDHGCIRVMNAEGKPATLGPDAALSAARSAVGDTAANASQTVFGKVSDCKRPSARVRVAWVYEFPPHVVAIDANTGKVLLDRAVTGS